MDYDGRGIHATPARVTRPLSRVIAGGGVGPRRILVDLWTTFGSYRRVYIYIYMSYLINMDNLFHHEGDMQLFCNAGAREKRWIHMSTCVAPVSRLPRCVSSESCHG